MGSKRACLTLAALLTVTLLLAVTATAWAIPGITNLTSTTHPDESTWYANNDPEFAWSTEASPLVSGTIDTPGSANKVTVAGDLAFVADGSSGLQIVDTSDPSNPVLLGAWDSPGNAVDISISGDYAYLADSYGGLHVVDVRIPANPSLAGSITTPGFASRIALSGDKLYVADGNLQVVDISDPANPVIVGSCDLGNSSQNIAVSGGLAVLGKGYGASGGLQFVDVSDPTNPVLRGFAGIDQLGGDIYDPSIADVAIDGDTAFAYVTRSFCTSYLTGPPGPCLYSYNWQNLYAIDASDPDAPAQAGNYSRDSGGYPGGPYTGGGVDVSDGIAYVADGRNRVALLDVSDPTTMMDLGDVYASTPNQAVAASGMIFIPSRSYGLKIMSANNFVGPRYSYTLDQSPDTVPDSIPEGFETSVAYTDLPDGEYWFHVAVVEGGVVGPASHRQVRIGTGEPPTPKAVIGLRSPTHIYDAVWYQDADPVFEWGTQVEMGQTEHVDIDTPGEARAVAMAGNLVVIADGSEGLRIIDVNDPAAPFHLGWYDTPGDAKDVAVAGNLVFLADGANGLVIFDITNPAGPLPIGSFDTPGDAKKVAVAGNFAYVADSTGGLRIIDATDPANPVLAATVAGSGPVDSVDASGNVAYVADSTAGMRVLDVTDPYNPVEVSLVGLDLLKEPDSIYIPDTVNHVSVKDGYAYLTLEYRVCAEWIGYCIEWYSGYYTTIVDIGDPAAPVVHGSYSGGFVEAVVDGGFAYDGYYTFVDVRDVQDPDKPAFFGRINSLPPYVSDLALQGGNIYIANYYTYLSNHSSGLVIIPNIDGLLDAQFSYVLDHSPDTVPDSVPETSERSVTFTGLADGEYWFHVAAVEGGVVGPAQHRRVRIGAHCGQAPDVRIDSFTPYWQSYQAYVDRELSVDYEFANHGAGPAVGFTLTGATATNGVTFCEACGSGMGVGDIEPGTSTSYTGVFIVPHGVSHFRTSFTGSAQDVCGNSYSYGS